MGPGRDGRLANDTSRIMDVESFPQIATAMAAPDIKVTNDPGEDSATQNRRAESTPKSRFPTLNFSKDILLEGFSILLASNFCATSWCSHHQLGKYSPSTFSAPLSEGGVPLSGHMFNCVLVKLES